jgi:hypothetical protein
VVGFDGLVQVEFRCHLGSDLMSLLLSFGGQSILTTVTLRRPTQGKAPHHTFLMVHPALLLYRVVKRGSGKPQPGAINPGTPE